MSRREPAAVRWVGKTALVTGASSGIGRAVALDLAKRGAQVVIAGRRRQALDETLSVNPGMGAVTLDIESPAAIREFATRLEKEYPALNAVIHNAGIMRPENLTEPGYSADAEAMITTNLLGPMFCTRELLPLLQAAPATLRMPVVANVASIAGRVAIPRSADYTASKFGLVGMTESLWHDLTASDIKVMMVNPGPVDTEGFPMAKVKAVPGLAWTVMEPARVARAIVRGIERGTFEVRVQWWFHPVYHAAVLAGSARPRSPAKPSTNSARAGS